MFLLQVIRTQTLEPAHHFILGLSLVYNQALTPCRERVSRRAIGGNSSSHVQVPAAPVILLGPWNYGMDPLTEPHTTLLCIRAMIQLRWSAEFDGHWLNVVAHVCHLST